MIKNGKSTVLSLDANDMQSHRTGQGCEMAVLFIHLSAYYEVSKEVDERGKDMLLPTIQYLEGWVTTCVEWWSTGLMVVGWW